VRFSPFNFIDVDRDGQPTDGDEIVFHDKMLTRGDQVGDELGSCVIVDEGVAGGTGSYRTVHGEGTLVEAGDGTGTLTLRIVR
jgi:hypothetical protein